MDERIFWMNCNQHGTYESGVPLTESQLRELFPEGNGTGFSADKFLEGVAADPEFEAEGYYTGSNSFTMKEVHSEEELKSLMTWENYSITDSIAYTEDRDFEYPDFVHEDLQMPGYLYEFTGYTSLVLPNEEYNDTVARYMTKFGLTEDDLSYNPTDKELAAKEIADVLYDEEELTVDKYEEILDEYELPEYAAPNLGDSLSNMESPAEGMEQ